MKVGQRIIGLRCYSRRIAEQTRNRLQRSSLIVGAQTKDSTVREQGKTSEAEHVLSITDQTTPRHYASTGLKRITVPEPSFYLAATEAPRHLAARIRTSNRCRRTELIGCTALLSQHRAY